MPLSDENKKSQTFGNFKKQKIKIISLARLCRAERKFNMIKKTVKKAKDRKLSTKIDYFSKRNTYGIKKGSKSINIDCYDGKTRHIPNTPLNR